MSTGIINIDSGTIQCNADCDRLNVEYSESIDSQIQTGDAVSYDDSGRGDVTNIQKVVASETILKPKVLTANPAGHLQGEMFTNDGLEFPETVEVLNSTRPGGKADIKNIDQDNDGFGNWTSKGKYPNLAQTIRFTRGTTVEEITYKTDGTR